MSSGTVADLYQEGVAELNRQFGHNDDIINGITQPSNGDALRRSIAAQATFERSLQQTQSLHPLDVQVGGDHYKKLAIQPFDYVHGNKIPFAEGSIIYYVTRWRDKGGIKDLEKAKHFIEMLIAAEIKETGI